MEISDRKLFFLPTVTSLLIRSVGHDPRASAEYGPGIRRNHIRVFAFR
jgi:hypothetical protein